MDTRQSLAALLLLASGVGARAQDAAAFHAQHSTHREIQFVSEYIRALSEIESIRAGAERELKAARSPQARFSSCVHTSRLQMHALANAENRAASYALDGNASQTPDLLVNYYVAKGEMFHSLGSMCQAMLQGSNPSLEKIATRMPKLRTDMEDLDKSLLQISVMVFAVLISPTPDKAGRMNHLIVTKRERDGLVHQISTSFKRLDAKEESYPVSAATVLWEYLARKGYRCADEPA